MLNGHENRPFFGGLQGKLDELSRELFEEIKTNKPENYQQFSIIFNGIHQKYFDKISVNFEEIQRNLVESLGENCSEIRRQSIKTLLSIIEENYKKYMEEKTNFVGEPQVNFSTISVVILRA